MKKPKLKNILVLSVVIFCSLLAAASILLYQNGVSWVAEVNGYRITAEEYGIALSENRALVYDYFSRKYGASDSKDFWDTSLNGEKPSDLLKQRALEQCTRYKIQQILAKEQALIDDIGYKEIRRLWIQENKRREDAVNQGKVIYGPTQYGESEYYRYLLGNLVIGIKDHLKKSLPFFDEEALKTYYDSHKDQYKLADRVKAIRLTVNFTKEGTDTFPSAEKARQLVEDARQQALGGRDFKEIAEEFDNSKTTVEVEFSQSTSRRDEFQYKKLLEVISAMKPGDISDIIEQESSYTLLKCLSREPEGYKAFEEVKGQIETDIANTRYEEWIDKLVKEAKITYNQKAIDFIRMTH